jgi:hypothetical protein
MGAQAGSEDATSKLEEMLAGSETESSAVEKSGETEETRETTKGKAATGKGAVPYERFQEVVGQKNTYAEKYAELEKASSEDRTALTKLAAMLEEKEKDTTLLNDIRALAIDPKYRDALELIDKGLRGIEDEVKTGEISPKEANVETKKLIAKQSAIENSIADQRAELIIQRADLLADKWLEALPNDYTEADRKVIANLWTNNVDWNKVEQNPNQLDSILAQSFQESVNTFGIPRGKLINPDDVEFVEETTKQDARDPVEELSTLLKDKQYGAMKTVKTYGGREISMPAVSDDDFATDMAKFLKARR